MNSTFLATKGGRASPEAPLQLNNIHTKHAYTRRCPGHGEPPGRIIALPMKFPHPEEYRVQFYFSFYLCPPRFEFAAVLHARSGG